MFNKLLARLRPVDEPPPPKARIIAGDPVEVLTEYHVLPGWVLEVYPATQRALVQVFDPVLGGGCWRQVAFDL